RGDQIAPERPQPCQRALLIAAREAAEADHVSGKDGSKLSLFGHRGRRPRFCCAEGSLLYPTRGRKVAKGRSATAGCAVISRGRPWFLHLPREMRFHGRPLAGNNTVDAGVAKRSVACYLMAA